MDSQNMTLGEFVQQLLVQIGDHELHFKHERPWHELFYGLKTGPEKPGRPRFLNNLFFDWNGEYPKSQELSEYLHALHWTGCMAAANPGYDRFKLNPEIRNLWRTQLDGQLGDFVAEAAETAKHDLAVQNAR